MIAVLLLSLLSCAFFYVEAVKWGMNAKTWAFGGLVLGPLLMPMFAISRHIQWRNAVGFNNLYISA